jgi:hypothetical protein
MRRSATTRPRSTESSRSTRGASYSIESEVHDGQFRSCLVDSCYVTGKLDRAGPGSSAQVRKTPAIVHSHLLGRATERGNADSTFLHTHGPKPASARLRCRKQSGRWWRISARRRCASAASAGSRAVRRSSVSNRLARGALARGLSFVSRRRDRKLAEANSLRSLSIAPVIRLDGPWPAGAPWTDRGGRECGQDRFKFRRVTSCDVGTVVFDDQAGELLASQCQAS